MLAFRRVFIFIFAWHLHMPEWLKLSGAIHYGGLRGHSRFGTLNSGNNEPADGDTVFFRNHCVNDMKINPQFLQAVRAHLGYLVLACLTHNPRLRRSIPDW